MRGAPQVGFSATIRKIKARSSLRTHFRPPTCLNLETQVQYKRNPARCQFTTVLGVTKTRGLLHPDQQVLNATQNSLCRAVHRWRRSHDQSEDVLLRTAGSDPDGSDLDRRSRRSNAGWGRRKDVASALEAFLGVSTPWFGLMEGSEIPEEKTAEPSTVRDPTSNSTNHRRRNTPSKCIPA